MIAVARGISAEAVERGEVETVKGEAVVFVEGTAEELEGPWRGENGGRKVDLLTASTAVCVFVYCSSHVFCVANGLLVPI